MASAHPDLLYHNDFDGTGREQADNSCVTRNDGSGFLIRNVNEGGSCYWSLWNAGDFEPGVRITLEAGLRSGPREEGFGLKFGTADQSNSSYYAFVVTAEGFHRLGRWNGGFEWVTDAVESPAIRTEPGELNSISVEVRGSVIDYYVNGSYLGTYQAPEPVRGSVGLYVYRVGLEVIFDDLKVESLVRR